MIDTLAWILVGVTLLPAHRLAQQTSRSLFAALVTIEAIALSMIFVAGADKDQWSALAQEDGIVEWATFLAFVMAAGWLVVVVRKLSPSWWFKGACFLLALFCLVVAGEEISWGQRLFGFKPPDVFLERNFQQEANLHNVLMHEGGLGFKIESKHLVMAIVMGFCLAWPWIVRRKRFTVFTPLAPSRALVPLALGVVAAELGYTVELTGEGAELVVGLIFLASALTATTLRTRTIVTIMLAPIIGGWLLTLGLSRIVYGSDEEGTALAKQELAQLATDVATHTTEKLEKKNIHKRMFTSVHDGYLALQTGKDRKGYFLDPWNNPYWVIYDKKARKGAVYSFGPNRKRDVMIRDVMSDPGDDIVVRFELPPKPADD